MLEEDRIIRVLRYILNTVLSVIVCEDFSAPFQKLNILVVG